MSDKPEIMLGMTMPDVDVWSERVTVALGQNPSRFTGPGTNTYLVGTGEKRILLDTGEGHVKYPAVLEAAIERAGCTGIDKIVLTHGHPDHMGGVAQVRERWGAELIVHKLPWPEIDRASGIAIEVVEDGDVIETEGATLRALHTPGHAPDHVCWILEEEQGLFSGDNVLGVGTTVIPSQSGSLPDYMKSLERLRDATPKRIFPAHGPCIENGTSKIQEYIDHRMERERQVLEALGSGANEVMAMVRIIYAAYPEALHAAAAQSVISHLLKLEMDGVVRRDGDTRWSLVD